MNTEKSAFNIFIKYIFIRNTDTAKSHIWDTLNLLTCAESSTDTKTFQKMILFSSNLHPTFGYFCLACRSKINPPQKNQSVNFRDFFLFLKIQKLKHFYPALFSKESFFQKNV